MAIFKSFSYAYNTAAMYEDPTPGSNKLYFQLDAYDKTSLAPQNGVGINWNLAGSYLQGFGTSNTYASSSVYFSIYDGTGNSFTGSNMFRLGLNGPVVDVQTLSVTANSSMVNIEPIMFLSMDPSRPIRKTRYDTYGANTAIISTGCKIAHSESSFRTNSFDTTVMYNTYYSIRTNTTDISNSLPITNNNVYDYSGFSGYSPYRTASLQYPIYFNQSTNNMVVLGWGGWWQPDTVNDGYYEQFPLSAPYGMRFTNYFSASPSLSCPTTSNTNKTNQFLGVDNGGRAWFFQDDVVTDYNFLIIRYTDSDNTATAMFTSNTAPSAGGTSAGGNRGTNYGSYYPKYSSQTFTDPLNANAVAWYTPYNDVNGNIQPYYFQWDKNLDTVAASANLSVSWGNTSQTNEWAVDNISGSSQNSRWGMQRLVFNDVFTHNDGATTRRYLMWGQLNGTGTAYDGNSKQRTFVIFLVDPSNPRTLTYHSSIVVPSTPINILWIDNTRNQLAVVSAFATYFYNFTHATGWVLSATLPIRLASLGVDSLGRIWGLAPGATKAGQVHLITNQIPITISVTAANSSYNYTGSNIASNVIVNTYNTTGSRVAANIKLAINGTSMTFSGANLTTNVTTSNSANTLVPINITGSGTSTIVASVNL